MMKDITITQAQDVQFDLFLQFKRICEENGLRYYLSGGTLLGAVRHKGFIPWDDDMDVMLPRADYDRLIHMQLDLPAHMRLFACETDREYLFPFAKLCDMRYKLYFAHHREERSIGMYIDIFPIETLPDSRLEMKFYFKKMKLLNILHNAAMRRAFLPDEKFIFVKKLIQPFAVRHGANRYVREMNDFARRYADRKTDHSGVTMVLHYGEREWMRRAVFEPSAAVEFRGVACAAPKGWDEYLRNLYGDYMVLPPESQRVSNHPNFTIEIRE